METTTHSIGESSSNFSSYNSILSSFSNSTRSNGSIQLLYADFYSFMLFMRGSSLKSSALTISRNFKIFNPDKLKSPSNSLSESPKADMDKCKANHENRFVDYEDFDLSCVNFCLVNRHKFLCNFKQLDLFGCHESEYNRIFYEFESYIIKLFSVHPTLGSGSRGLFLEDDGSMIYSCLNYIRLYEHTMHLLSQKLHHHFYLTIFVLIVLLRNVRRLLHHYKTNATLFDFIVMMIEAIHICQNHLYNTFLSDKRVYRGSSYDKYVHKLFYDQLKSVRNKRNNLSLTVYLESLKRHNDECNSCKNDIYNICREERLNSEVGSVPDTPSDSQSISRFSSRSIGEGDADGVTSIGDNELSILREHSNPMLTKREEYFDSTLDYDKSEIFHLLYLNVVLDCEISKWISELCKLANMYCKIGNSPVLLERKFTKLALNSESSVVPSLCATPFRNFSALRSFRVKRCYLRRRKAKNALTPQHSVRLEPEFHHEHHQEQQEEHHVEFISDPEPFTASEQTTPVNNPLKLRKVSKTLSPVKPKKPKRSSARTLRKGTRMVEKPKKPKYQKWNMDEVQLFIKALNTYGDGKWRHIEQMYFLGKKSQSQLKDKWVNLVKFGHIKKVEVVRENGTIGRLWVPVESPARRTV